MCIGCDTGSVGDYCENCEFNVIGPYCNVCADGFYGLTQDHKNCKRKLNKQSIRWDPEGPFRRSHERFHGDF